MGMKWEYLKGPDTGLVVGDKKLKLKDPDGYKRSIWNKTGWTRYNSITSEWEECEDPGFRELTIDPLDEC